MCSTIPDHVGIPQTSGPLTELIQNLFSGGSWGETCSVMSWTGSVVSAYCNYCVDTKGQHHVVGSKDKTLVYGQLFVYIDASFCSGYDPTASGQGVSISNNCGALVC